MSNDSILLENNLTFTKSNTFSFYSLNYKLNQNNYSFNLDSIYQYDSMPNECQDTPNNHPEIREGFSSILSDDNNYNGDKLGLFNNISSNNNISILPIKEEQNTNKNDINQYMSIQNIRKEYFRVIYPQKFYLFTFSRKENQIFKYFEKKECLSYLKKERSSKRKNRLFLRFNIRIKVKRAFLNILINKVLEICEI